MKRLSILLMFLLITAPAFSFNEPNSEVKSAEPVENTQPFTAEEVAAIEARIVEIKEMDKSELSRVEKKALRVELRDMKREIRERDEHHHREGGIYISTGALLLIILLIIIL